MVLRVMGSVVYGSGERREISDRREISRTIHSMERERKKGN